MVAAQAWPLFAFLDVELFRLGVQRPREQLMDMLPELVQFEAPLKPDTPIRARVKGLAFVDRSMPALAHFVPFVRRCYDFYNGHEPRSPSQTQDVVVSATRLAWPDPLSRELLTMLGLLLDVEGIGRVEWTPDGEAPWAIPLDDRIRRFAKIGSLDDFITRTE